MDFDREAACSGFNFDVEDIWSVLTPERESQQEAEQVGHVSRVSVPNVNWRFQSFERISVQVVSCRTPSFLES